MSDLVAIGYDDLDTARRVATNVTNAQKEHVIELQDLAIVERRQDGKIKLHQTNLTAAGAAGGALWGGLIGLIFLAPLLGMAVGAAAGVDDKFMKELGEHLEPGKAALILLISKVTVDKVLPQIQIPGKVIQTSLSHDDEESLQQALDAARPAAAS